MAAPRTHFCPRKDTNFREAFAPFVFLCGFYKTNMILNPHLEGDSFFWEGGPVGIVLSHGFRATAAEVRPLARILRQKGYSVAGPLLPGHKTSIEDMNRRRWREWAAAVEETYQTMAARAERVFVGGESMGAMLALRTASHHPEAAGILAYAPAMRLAGVNRLQLWLISLFMQSVPRRKAPRTVVDDLWQGYERRPTRAVFQLLAIQREIDRSLAGIRQPILIVQGKLDTTVELSGAEHIHNRIGSAAKELHWLDRSTHCVILDQELPQVAEITINFIERILGEPRREK